MEDTKMVWEHEREIWEKYYPKASPILDIGADPESVKFFEENGQQVIPIGDMYGTHIEAMKIDIDGSEQGMILETHFPVKWTLLHRFPGTETRIWRLDKREKTVWMRLWRRGLRILGVSNP